MPPPVRLQNVQCLRAVAAMLVIAVHEPDFETAIFGSSLIGWAHVPGGIGVDLFFVISGFIMVTTTWNVFGRDGAALRFLLRRVERIYPVYWIMTAAYLTLHVAVAHDIAAQFASLPEIVASFFLIPHGTDPVLTVGWTLQYEMVFYLVFALALVFARHRLGTVLALWALVVLAASVLDRRVPSVTLGFVGGPLNFEFLFGVVIGALLSAGRVIAPLPVLVAGMAGVAAICLYTSPLPALPSTWFRAFVVAPSMALVLYGAVATEMRYGRTGARWLVTFGDASYSLYLSHTMVLGTIALAARRLGVHGVAAQIIFVVATYAACLGASLVLYRTVERPLLGAAHRLHLRHEKKRLPAVASL